MPAASELLEACLAGRPWPREALAALLRDPDEAAAGRALFGTVAEGLSDRFEPALGECYAAIFSEAFAPLLEGCSAAGLRQRYAEVRLVRPYAGPEPRRVVVPSRVTLGADVAVTSVLLAAAAERFPRAELWLAGPAKNAALFAAEPRVVAVPLGYGRGGSIRERLAVLPELRAMVAEGDSLLLDPDSRLTQLGLLPVCPPERHLLFDSRSYGAETELPLSVLAGRWAREVLGVAASPFLAPAAGALPVQGKPLVTVSLGVGGNAAKRLPDPFEAELLQALSRRGFVLVDRGVAAEEQARVERAARGLDGGRVRAWEGAFAEFAWIIGQSDLYVGYDSAGQHAAAACGTPQVTVFAGHVSPRMLARWTPAGRGASKVVRMEKQTPREALEAVLASADELLARAGAR